MYSIEPFYPSDIFALDLANLDSTTENYAFEYYLHYLLHHSDDCYKVCSVSTIESQFLYSRAVLAYLIGKHETATDFHAHVTALTVAPQYRRLGFGAQLMNILRENGLQNGAKFIDLFVRVSNEKAIRFYHHLGYVVHRTVFHYYASPVEDAYDMRLYLQ
eukprot:jgi/Antlo1/860/1971